MIRRRHEHGDVSTGASDLQLPSRLSDMQHEHAMDMDKKQPSCFGSIRTLIQTRAILVVICLLFAGLVAVTSLLPKKVPNLEHPFRNQPYLKAKLFNPFRYLQAKYLSERPKIENIRTFVMTNETAFVVNLDSDVHRIQTFWSKNHPASSKNLIQRFSAHQWRTDVTLPGAIETMQRQHFWEEQYPFLRDSVKRGRFGDAACALSHIWLWQRELMEHVERDYLFVFEDDVKLLEPLRSKFAVQAPDLADVVFLAATATKRVAIAWQDDKAHHATATDSAATRVVGGHGTLGYIITREGTLKMFQYLKQSRKPIDLSIFDAPSSLNIYLPVRGQWPSVVHDQIPSSRLALNQPSV